MRGRQWPHERRPGRLRCRNTGLRNAPLAYSWKNVEKIHCKFDVGGFVWYISEVLQFAAQAG